MGIGDSYGRADNGFFSVLKQVLISMDVRCLHTIVDLGQDTSAP